MWKAATLEDILDGLPPSPMLKFQVVLTVHRALEEIHLPYGHVSSYLCNLYWFVYFPLRTTRPNSLEARASHGHVV